MPDSLSADALALRQLIDTFIGERRDAKLDKVSPDDPKYQHLVDQFQKDTWIQDAARRAGQLQVVTHVLKGIHPDAKGTNLFVLPSSLATPPGAIGSHVLADTLSQDVTGNAAALDVYKFLKLTHNNRTLLDLIQQRDPNALSALSDDTAQAARWADDFAAITASKTPPTSHVSAKQMYWLTGNDPKKNEDFVLLAPLFPSSLVHEVHSLLQHDRFSEEAKDARKARKELKPSAYEARTYNNLAIRKLGGTKPQNVSQLNSERGGQNVLLASLPPQWNSAEIAPILGKTSAYPRLRHYPAFANPAHQLRRFLQALPSPPEKGPHDKDGNLKTRDTVHRLTAEMIEGVIDFTLHMHQLPAGWTTQQRTYEDGTVLKCDLPAHQQHWLDPLRAEDDAAFRSARATSRWQEQLKREIAEEINRWLNTGTHRINAGDIEQNEWQRRMDRHPAIQALFDEDGAFMDALLTDVIETIDEEDA